MLLVSLTIMGERESGGGGRGKEPLVLKAGFSDGSD